VHDIALKEVTCWCYLIFLTSLSAAVMKKIQLELPYTGELEAHDLKITVSLMAPKPAILLPGKYLLIHLSRCAVVID
jgi:hypothetical protein